MSSSTSRLGVSKAPASTRDNPGDAHGRTQLDLFTVPVGDSAQWDKARRLIAEAIDEIGTKQAAFDLDMQPSLLLHCLAERDRHRISGKVVVYAVAHQRSGNLLRFLAATSGREVITPESMTPEEELIRTKEAVRRLFGDAGATMIGNEVKSR